MSDLSEAIARFEAWGHALEVKLHLIHEQTQATHVTLTGQPPVAPPSTPPLGPPIPPGTPSAPPKERTPAVLGADGVITGDGAEYCSQFLGDNAANILSAMRTGLALKQGLDEIARRGWESDLTRCDLANRKQPDGSVALVVWAGNPAVFDDQGNQLPGTYKNAIPQHYYDLATQAVALGALKLPD